jgi:hypothetical protein
LIDKTKAIALREESAIAFCQTPSTRFLMMIVQDEFDSQASAESELEDYIEQLG